MLHQCFIDISSSPRRALVTGVDVSFDSSFSLHSLVMSSTCVAASTSIRIPVGSISLLCTSCVFPSALRRTIFGLIRGVICVSKCAVRTHSIDVATLPLEGKLIPRCTTTHPWFSETKVIGTPITSSPIRMFLTSPQHLFVSCFFVPCRHVSPDNTCYAVSFLHE